MCTSVEWNLFLVGCLVGRWWAGVPILHYIIGTPYSNYIYYYSIFIKYSSGIILTGCPSPTSFTYIIWMFLYLWKKITNFRVSQRREEMLKDAYLAIRVFVTSITTNNLGGRLSYKLGYYGKELMRFLIYQAQKTMF